MAKKVNRREWTKDDVRELKTLARQKTPVAKIAKSLKRTPGATQQKAFTLGVSLDTRGLASLRSSCRSAPRFLVRPALLGLHQPERREQGDLGRFEPVDSFIPLADDIELVK